MKKSITVGKNGSLQLPKDIRAKYKITTGSWLRVIPFGKNLVFIPLGAEISELARKIESVPSEAK